jgi:uncharacterized protein YfkK (UPF0435 family)
MGFYTKSDKSKLQLLETTLVGNVDLSEIYEDTQYVYNLTKYYNYLSSSTLNDYMNGLTTLDLVKKEISYNSFLEAVNYEVDSFNSNVSKFADVNNYDYKIFDIEALRKVVQPIPSKK